MSYAFSASPVNYKEDDLEAKILSEKSKLNRQYLEQQLTGKTAPPAVSVAGNMARFNNSASSSKADYSNVGVAEIHSNIKDDNADELSAFYQSELSNNKYAPIMQTSSNPYLLMEDQHLVKKATSPAGNREMLEKINRLLEMFEEQREIRTGKKTEEVVLFTFLGLFTIYVLDSFVSIGKYSR